MNNKLRIPTNKAPPTPGYILLKYFLILEKCPESLQKIICDIVYGKTRITKGHAIRLSKYFGNTKGFWLNAQEMTDLYKKSN